TKSGNNYSFQLLASDFQPDGQQGPVNFTFVASDNAGNPGTSAVQTVKVDRKVPGMTIDPIPAGSSGGYYKSSESVPVTVHVDDGAGTSGLGSVSVTLLSASGATISTSTNTAGVFTVNVPGTNQTNGSEADIAINVVATDAVGNATPPTAGGTLKIDRKAPVATSIPINSPDANGRDGDRWVTRG